jgi:hypothetical protein
MGLNMCTETNIAEEMPAEHEMKILQFQKFVTADRKTSCSDVGLMLVRLAFNVPLNKTAH